MKFFHTDGTGAQKQSFM